MKISVLSSTYNGSDQMTSFTFTDPAWDSTSFTDPTSAEWNNTGSGYAYYQLTDPTNWMVWFNPNLGTTDDSFAFGSADILPDQFIYGTSNPPDDSDCAGGAGCFLGDGEGTVSYSTVSTPEGGFALLYLLLAGAVCGGAMYFASRQRFFTAKAE